MLRFSRLYPLHFISLGIVAITQAIREIVGLEQFMFKNNDFYNFILSIFLFQEMGISNDSFNGVAWTLSVSVILYFLFFWVCKKTENNSQLFMWSVIFVLIGIRIIRFPIDCLFTTRADVRGLVSFFCGVIFAEVLISFKSKKIMDLVFALTPFIFLCFKKILWIDVYNSGHIYSMCVMIAYFIPIIYFSVRINFLSKILSCKIMKWLGNLSFSIFITHYPVQVCISTINEYFELNFDYSKLGTWFVYVVISIMVAYLLHIFIEIPMSKKIRTYYYENYTSSNAS